MEQNKFNRKNLSRKSELCNRKSGTCESVRFFRNYSNCFLISFKSVF